MLYLEKTAKQFMEVDNGSYSRLADLLNRLSPRPDGIRWTKDSAYHFCRTHGINSNRRCRNQPAAGCSQRARTRQAIIAATLDALATDGKTIFDIAPVELKAVVRLSGSPLHNVRNNWHELANDLNTLAGIPPTLFIVED